MPQYEFMNKNTNEVETHEMRISEYDAFKEANPHLERYMGNARTALGDPFHLGVSKPPSAFVDNIKRMQAAIPQNKIKSKYNWY